MNELEYWNEVKSLATSIVSEVTDDNPDFTEEAIEAIYERLHETIDGHQWIIYYSYNLDVIKHSDNEDYMADNIGGLDETVKDNGFTGLCQAVAYWAFYADVLEELYTLIH